MSELTITQQLAQRDSERMKSYKDALDFYHGNQWECRAARGEKRLTFNYSKVFIDKITSYLMSGVGFAVDPVTDSAESRAKAQRAETLLQQVYQDNNLEQLDLETEIDAAILGDACYKITWDETAKRVRVTAPDIQGIYAWWAGDDMSRVWRVAARYSLSAEEAAFLYPMQPKTKTATVTEVWTDDNFELYLDDVLIEKKANPYGFIPFVIFPNLREPKKFWGTSDLTQITEIQREMNRTESFGEHNLRVIWTPVLPKDVARQVANEQVLVQTGIHSRRHAMYELGIGNPELEFRKWLEERENILKMNRELNAKSLKTPVRERVLESPESIEE